MPIIDMTTITEENHTADEWRHLIDTMRGEDPVQVHQSIADYFLNVLTPIDIGQDYFVFREGGSPIAFSEIRKEGQTLCFARRGARPYFG